jgi:serine/threonine protein phosphatase PrpC
MDVAVGSELGIWQRHSGDAHLSESLAGNVTLFGVADGFGASGRDLPAATMALGWVRDYLRRRQRLGAFARHVSPSDLRSLLLGALDYANGRLYEQSGSHDDFVAGGTSLTAVLIANHHALVAHVGDARAYLVRLGRLEVLTNDDAIFAEVETTAKTSLPARAVRSLLWRSLGTQPKLEASVTHVELLAGDQIALCTAGIHRCISLDEIGETLVSSDSSSAAVTRLLALLRTRGILDNGTLVIGRDLLAGWTSPVPAQPRREHRLKTIAALVMLVCTGLFLAYFVYREGTLPPATETVSGDHR